MYSYLSLSLSLSQLQYSGRVHTKIKPWLNGDSEMTFEKWKTMSSINSMCFKCTQYIN